MNDTADADTQLQMEILDCRHDDARCIHLIIAYWRDGDRADRAPRDLMYLHLGILSGIAHRLSARASALEAKVRALQDNAAS